MSTEYYLKFPIDSRLYLEFRKQRAASMLSTNFFIFNLLVNTDYPQEFESNYRPNYHNGKTKKFSQRLQKSTYLKFRIFSAYFKTHSLTLDYLLWNNKKEKENLEFGDSINQ